jgi:single-strand DNA-binding protein
MARTYNKVMLIGNVGNDPELNHTPSGIPVTNFRLATSENRKDKDGNGVTHTDWHTIVAWRGLAEIVQKMVFRSSRVFVEGKIQTRSFEDKMGNHRKVVEILAEKILLLDGNKKKEGYEKSGTEVNEHTNGYYSNDNFDVAQDEAEVLEEMFVADMGNGDIPF